MTCPFPAVAPRELALLSNLDRMRRTEVTSDEARELLGDASHRVLSDMARKGLLDRISRGLYVVRPLHAVGGPWSVTAAAAVEHLLTGEPHYIGGSLAFTLHRLTQQQHMSVVDAYVLRRRRRRTISHASVRFHIVEPERIELGSARYPIEGVSVAMSDPEKTVLDTLDHPAAFGGLHEAVRMVNRALDRVDADIVIEYALQLSRPSTLQRLGVLLERHDTASSRLGALADRVRSSSNKAAMVPGPRVGRLHPSWHIIENDLETS